MPFGRVSWVGRSMSLMTICCEWMDLEENGTYSRYMLSCVAAQNKTSIFVAYRGIIMHFRITVIAVLVLSVSSFCHAQGTATCDHWTFFKTFSPSGINRWNTVVGTGTLSGSIVGFEAIGRSRLGCSRKCRHRVERCGIRSLSSIVGGSSTISAGVWCLSPHWCYCFSAG